MKTKPEEKANRPARKVVEVLTDEGNKQDYRPVLVSNVLLVFLNSLVFKCPKCGEDVPLKFK